MFALQQAIQQAQPQLSDWWQRYDLPSSEIETLLAENQSFIMRVPLIGAFSAGKSSLINTMLKDKLLVVDIDPASSIPIELYYSTQERILGHRSNGQQVTIGREQLRSQTSDGQQESAMQQLGLVPDGWIEAHLTNTVLQPLSHMCLVDMPGLDSKHEQHDKAIRNYLGRSLAYCLVVSAEAGTLPESTRRFLQELKLHQVPVLLVISKTDKKLPADLPAIVQQIEQQVIDLLGSAERLQVVTASRKDTSDFVAALAGLEQRSEQRLRETVGRHAMGLLAGLNQKLELLLQADDLDAEKIRLQRDEQRQQMQDFERKFQQETQQLHNRLSGVQQKILTRVEHQLRAQLESLTSAMVSGSDISSSISHSVRLAVVEGMTQDFAPLVQQYQDRVQQELPNQIQIGAAFQFEKSESSDWTSTVSNGLLMVAPLALKFPPLAVVITIVATLLKIFGGKRDAEAEREQQCEQARHHILDTVIPQVMQQVTHGVQQSIDEQVAQVQASLAAKATAQEQALQHTLQQLEAELQQTESKRAAIKTQQQADQAAVQQLAIRLKAL